MHCSSFVVLLMLAAADPAGATEPPPPKETLSPSSPSPIGAPDRDTPMVPTTYELMLNGETFTVRLDKSAKLESAGKQAASYQVALRVAMKQRVELNTLEFEYDWPAAVSDDHGREARSIRLRHEMGFDLQLTDMGHPIQPAAREESLKILAESMTETFREANATNLNVVHRPERDFGGSQGPSVKITYQDPQGFNHTCHVYLLTGERFAASCVVQYYNRNAEHAVPRIENIIASVKGLK